MVNSWERTSFGPLSLTNTLWDKSECSMSLNGELDANYRTQQNIKEVRGWLILYEWVFLSVKKPPSIFVIVFIDRSSQWNAVISQNIFIFIGSCYNYTVSIVSTYTLRNLFQGSWLACYLLTKKIRVIHSLFLQSLNMGWFLHCEKSKISS